MIKLFRNIRQKLLQSGKLKSYTAYALGEIILVVIGILIALWLNQRTSYNTERRNEITILQEIRNNLRNDLIEISQDIDFMDTVNIAGSFVRNYIVNSNIPNNQFGEKVARLRTTPHFNPNLSGYNLLVSKGIEIIQNDSLRRAISEHYESLYSYYEKYEQERIQFRIEHLEPLLIKYFSWKTTNNLHFLGQYTINDQDYNKLKIDNYFIKLVSAVERENILVQNRANKVRIMIRFLSSLLDDELKARS